MFAHFPMHRIKQQFAEAKLKVLSEQARSSCGIGSLCEKITHRILKYTYEPNDLYHEVDYYGCVADVKNGNCIYEIQTAGFERLNSKLQKFLSECNVTVIHPIIAEKYVYRLNKETGEFSPPRKSSHKKTLFDSAYDVFKLREFISNTNFSLKILYLSVDEYKNGEKRKRYGPTDLIERIPRDIIEIFTLRYKEDYRIFIPSDMPEEFTASDYLKATKSRSRYAYYGLRILLFLGLAAEVGSRGRAKIYRLT